MIWAALSIGEIVALWAAAGAAAVWLYLRFPRPITRRVASLKFWAAGSSRARRRRVREPWALAAQLLFLLLALLALGDPGIGAAPPARTVVIVLDTSIWSQVQPPGQPSWMDQAREEAMGVLATLSDGDRVLLLRADGDVSPLVPFTTDRQRVADALGGVQASGGAADLVRALALADAAVGDAPRALIVYVGPGRIAVGQADKLEALRAAIVAPDREGRHPELRVRLVGDGVSIMNAGVTGIAIRRDPAAPGRWRILTKLQNYSAAAAPLRLVLSVDGVPLARRQVTVAAGGSAGVQDVLDGGAGKLLTAMIELEDDVDADNRAAVTVPASAPIRVAVSSTDPAFQAELRQVLAANPYVAAVVEGIGRSVSAAADVTIYLATTPPANPPANSIWFVGGPARPGVPGIRVTDWNPAHPVTQWVRTLDVVAEDATDLSPAAGDVVLALRQGTSAPLVLARDQDGRKSLVIGFDPRRSTFPQQRSFPLLMAGALEWMAGPIEDAVESAGPAPLPGYAWRPAAEQQPLPNQTTAVYQRGEWWKWLTGFSVIALGLEWLLRDRTRRSYAALGLKAAAAAALLLALAGLSAQMPVRRLAITMVLDTSSSMSDAAIARGRALLAGLAERGTHAELRLITFAGQPALAPVQEEEPAAADARGIPMEELATDIEAAVQLGLSTLPGTGGRRLVLVSDGNETRGNLLQAVARAQQQGVSIHTVPPDGTGGWPIGVEYAALPEQVFSGERFSLALRLRSARSLNARLAVTSAGRQIAASGIQLHAGTNAIEIEARIDGAGVNVLEARLTADGVERVLLSHALAVRRPRLLYIQGDTGQSPLLRATLARAGIDIEARGSFPVSGSGDDWDAVLLDNYPNRELPSDEQAALEDYVHEGGGLVFVAGDGNAELKPEPSTPFERLLPVRGDPEIPDKPTALMLVVDKSQSMIALDKIGMARAAARDAVVTLRPTDRVGVIAFDDGFRWIAPIETVADPAPLVQLISGINASGGTRIYPPLKAAFDAIREERVDRRHIILLTDGVSPPGEMPQLLQDAAAQRVTITTVGIGPDINRDMLQTIATETGGRSYFVAKPAELPQVVSAETKKFKASPIEEVPVRAVSVRAAEVTDGIAFAGLPRLLGFVRTKSQTGSETILTTDRGEPLLVRWQYGLGRVTAFMSDGGSRWAAGWAASDAFGTLWPQIVRDVSTRDRSVRTTVAEGGEDELVVSYQLFDEARIRDAAGGLNRVVMAGPDAQMRTLRLDETAPGKYETRMPAHETGLYRFASGDSEAPLPLVGYYREVEELKPKVVNETLLRDIAAATGGAVNPTIDHLLDDAGTLALERQPLWPYWIILALAINFAELAIRRFSARLR